MDNKAAKRIHILLLVPVLVILAAMALSMSSPSLATVAVPNNQALSSVQQPSPSSTDVVTIQNTSVSIPAPNAPINNQSIPHQIVIALPIRADGKIWTGTATFSASKPIEVEVEHNYNPQVLPDAKHGLPLNAKWGDNTTRIALSPMTMFSSTPIFITNTPISTGSFVFSGSALVFHKTDEQPFTVTYTLDAVAKRLTTPTQKKMA